VNLAEPAETRAYRNFDVIFCRNLLIYFDDLSRKKAAETFYDALKPGGFICLGHSESMSRISSLYKLRKFPEAIVYEKPLETR
jgi:chemotaxis protein methyltransferase CheR